MSLKTFKNLLNKKQAKTKNKNSIILWITLVVLTRKNFVFKFLILRGFAPRADLRSLLPPFCQKNKIP